MPFDHVRHRGHIAARAKRAARAGDDDYMNIPLSAGGFKSFRQVTPHVSGEGVQLVRTIERDRRDAGVFNDVDVFHKKQ
jgi:hypothetical protein